MFLREGFKKKVKLRFLDKLRGRSYVGVHGPNPVNGIFYCNPIASKHEIKHSDIKMLCNPPPFTHSLNPMIFDNFVFISQVYHMGYKYLVKLFHVLRSVDFISRG